MLLLTGCPPIIQIAPPLMPGTGLDAIEAQDVSKSIDRRRADFQNLRGLGKVGIETWEERFRFSEVFVLDTPSRFRLETLGAFDQPAIFLTSNDSLLSLYSKKKNAVYRGIPSQENLFKLSGINLTVEDTIFVLSGNPPLLRTVDTEWGIFLPEQQLYYLERLSLQENRVQRIWFDTRLSVVTYLREHQLPSGKMFLEIQFDDYRAAAGDYPIPRRISINRPLENTLVNIEYESFWVNQDIDPTIFTFQPPDNAKVHILDNVHEDELGTLVPYDEFRVSD
jgi:outer membrane lipoprotein-sorting protein